MKLHMVHAALLQYDINSTLVTSRDYTKRYHNIEFGDGIPGASAWALFLQDLKPLGIRSWDIKQDRNGNWQVVTETYVVNFGAVNPGLFTAPRGQKRIARLEVTSVSPGFDRAFETALRNNTISFTTDQTPVVSRS